VDVVRYTVPDNVHQLHVQQTFHVWKTRRCQCGFRLLMMGGVSPEAWWASCKYGIIKFWYIVASCWIFLYERCYYICQILCAMSVLTKYILKYNKTIEYYWLILLVPSIVLGDKDSVIQRCDLSFAFLFVPYLQNMQMLLK